MKAIVSLSFSFTDFSCENVLIFTLKFLKKNKRKSTADLSVANVSGSLLKRLVVLA